MYVNIAFLGHPIFRQTHVTTRNTSLCKAKKEEPLGWWDEFSAFAFEALIKTFPTCIAVKTKSRAAPFRN